MRRDWGRRADQPEATRRRRSTSGSNDEARARLSGLSARLAKENHWTLEALEATTKSYAEELELGLGKLAQPLRAALTGTTTSPGIFDVLVLLGKDESLARIDAQASPAGKE